MDATSIKQRGPRHAVEVQAVLRLADGTQVPAEVGDLSPEGCSVMRELGIGEWLQLDLPGIGVIKGQVRWSIGGRSGVRFARKA